MGQGDEPLEALGGGGAEAEPLQGQEHAGPVEQPHDDGLAVDGGHGGDANVHPAAAQGHPDAPVLGQPALGDVHLRHDLDPRRDGRLQAPGRRLLLEEDAVDAVPDAQGVLEGLDVDVGGPRVDGVLDEEIDEPHHGRLERHVAQMIDVLVGVGRPVVVHPLHDPLQRGRHTLIGSIDRLGDGLGMCLPRASPRGPCSAAGRRR